MKKLNKLKGCIWVLLFFGITFSYFVWLSWKKLYDYIGDGWTVWIITGIVVLIGIITGIFSIKKVVEKFT